MFGGFYSGKRVLLTGHSGFKGSWLSMWLKKLGATVWGLAHEPSPPPNLHEIVCQPSIEKEWHADICDVSALEHAMREARPDVVFHMAAQSLVRPSYAEPVETLRVNALGTACLLDSVRKSGISCVVIVVTSDKCYENREWEYAYRETDRLGGHDPYSMSKAVAELIVQSWRRSYFRDSSVRAATARAGNVIGGGDYAVDRIVPDCIRSLVAGEPISVRNPQATRPWQHVLEPLSGYLWLAAQISQTGAGELLAPINFGPGSQMNRPVVDVVESILKTWEGRWVHPPQSSAPHEACRLNLSIEKAEALLGWVPVWGFEETMKQTVEWYHHRHCTDGADMYRRSLEQIAAYESAAASRGVAWASASLAS